MEIINEAIQEYDFKEKMIDLERIHIFNFDFRKAFPKSC